MKIGRILGRHFFFTAVFIAALSLQAGEGFDSNFDTYTNIVSITTPAPFSPTIPTVEADDSYVWYHYNKEGTGWWSGDPEYDGVGLTTAVSEQTIHFKTNQSVVMSSRSAAGDFAVWTGYCSCGNISGCSRVLYYSNYDTCVSPTNIECGAGTYWYTSPIGTDLGGNIFGNDIVYGPTNQYLDCGTITSGNSFYYHSHNAPPLNSGGACGRIPYKIFSGQGSIFDIDFRLTNGYPVPSIPNTMQAAGNFSVMRGSDNSPAPTAGYFDSNNSFHFSFSTTSLTNINDSGWEGPFYSVYVSTNLQTWQCIADWVSPTGDQVEFVDTDASTSSQRYYVVKDDLTFKCSEAYGFIRLSLTTGDSLISNPLLSSNLTIGTLLDGLPNFSTIQFWGATGFGLKATYSSGAWDIPNLPLTPGNGALLHLTANHVLTFIGEVVHGHTLNSLPAGLSVYASVVPQRRNLAQLGLNSSQNGDYVVKWINGASYGYTNISGSWIPSVPEFDAGQAGLFYCSTAKEGRTTFLALDGYAVSGPPEIASNDGSNGNPSGITIRWGFDFIGDVPSDAFYELRVNDGDPYAISLYSPVNSTNLLWDWTLVFNSGQYQSSQGDVVKLRYVHKNVVGPWSNTLHF